MPVRLVRLVLAGDDSVLRAVESGQWRPPEHRLPTLPALPFPGKDHGMLPLWVTAGSVGRAGSQHQSFLQAEHAGHTGATNSPAVAQDEGRFDAPERHSWARAYSRAKRAGWCSGIVEEAARIDLGGTGRQEGVVQEGPQQVIAQVEVERKVG